LANGWQQKTIAFILHDLFLDPDVYDPIFGKALIIVWSIIDFLIDHILSINFIARKLDFL
jgi:hypothetical protein